MSDAREPLSSAQITYAIARVLGEGALAALATIVESARGVGTKVLLEESGALAGTTGDEALDEALAARAREFLSSRAEAATFRVEDFAPELEEWRGARILFERIEPEPHVVVCGAGHVGASLARLAHAIGFRVTLVDDRADFVAPERFEGDEHRACRRARLGRCGHARNRHGARRICRGRHARSQRG